MRGKGGRVEAWRRPAGMRSVEEESWGRPYRRDGDKYIDMIKLIDK